MAKTNAWGFPESDKKARKLAIPVLVRNDQGTVSTVYVDAETGHEVTDFKDYEKYDQYTEDRRTLGLLPPKEEKKKVGEATKTEDEKKRQYEKDDRRNDQNATYGITKGAKRTDQNNFGYIDRPGAVSWSSALPGPMGLAGKAVNTALNVNNTVAANRARSFLGLDTKTNVKGMLSDEKGYIGDVNYNGVTSPVGFEAETKDKRTTLTPTEARMRAQLSGIKEATPKEKRANEKAFEKENPNARGLLGRFTNAITGPVKDVVADVKDSVSTPSTKSTTGTLGKEVVDRATTSSLSPTSSFVDTEESPRGLGALSPSFNAGINYAHPDRGPVTQGLNPRTVEMMDSLATNEPGGINVTSAHRTKAINDAVGGAKNSLHMTGDAIDVSTRGMTAQQKRDFVERSIMSGAMEMGTYKDGSLHLSSTQRVAPSDPSLTGGVTAMHNRSRDNYGSAPDWYKDGVEVSRLAATPTSRPEMDVSNPSVAFADPGLARAQSMDPNTRTLMAGTLAGEIDLSKTDLSTPAGRREAMGILSTMENRAGRFGSITGAIDAPAQYSTWGTDKAAATAAANYNANRSLYDGLVADYARDKTQNLGFTNYYNNGLVDPGWGTSMIDKEQIGPHSFGFLGDYGPQKFGKNIQTTSANNKVTPINASASATAKVDLSTAKATPTGMSGGMTSMENANRATTASTATGRTNTGTPASSNTSRGLSSSPGSTGGFGVGGDRSSAGKSTPAASTNRGSSLSTSKGSTGGFGVGGDRSSSGKSTSTKSSSTQSKGAASRSDGWT